MLEPILPILGIVVFLVYGFLAGLYGVVGWYYLSSVIRHRCELARARNSFTVIIQFAVFNAYVALLLALAWLMFVIFGGSDFALRRLFGRLWLASWACGVAWHVFVVQVRQKRRDEVPARTKSID